MKNLIIGRGNDSDVVIPDESDLVSRKHCTLSFSFFGKMTITDNSANGTFVNGVRITRETPVTRKDVISLANAWTLEWETIKDPYSSLRIVVGILCILFCLGAGGAGLWFWGHNDSTVTAQDSLTVSSDTIKKDSADIKGETNVKMEHKTHKHEKAKSDDQGKRHEHKHDKKNNDSKEQKSDDDSQKESSPSPKTPEIINKDVKVQKNSTSDNNAVKKNTPIIY